MNIYVGNLSWNLKDEDLSVDLADLNSPQDRLAIVVTEPLTTNEEWVAMQPGQLQVFVDGAIAQCCGASCTPACQLAAGTCLCPPAVTV